MTTLLREPADRANITREVRSRVVDDVQLRESNDGKIVFDGTASVVDTPYKVRDSIGEFEETIAKGAYHRTIKQKADVRLLVNHLGVPMARTKSRTLELSETPHLRSFAPSLDPANPTVQEIRSAMDRGDIDQMSIGFRVKDQEWSPDYTERIIREIELFDVSIVTFPASTTTSAHLRSLDDFMAELDIAELDPDDLLRAWAKIGELIPSDYADQLRALTADVVNQYAERDRADMDRLLARRHAPLHTIA